MTQETRLQRYQGTTALTKAEATEILQTIWPKAPANEVYKAALICQTYGLNPLMHHLALVPFKNKKTEQVEWVAIMAMKATRLIAARKKAFSYIENTPRLMTDEEQQTILGEIDRSKLWAITILQDAQGNVTPGYGFWPRGQEPYGTEKGNTKANMAMIRSERQAVDRMVPDALPHGVEVMEDLPMPPVVATVEPMSGEVLEAGIEGEEPQQGPEPSVPKSSSIVYLGGAYGDMLTSCWEHGEPWTLDKFQHLYHKMPEGFCQFRELIKPIVKDIGRELGLDANEINERVKKANDGKPWSKLSEQAQLEILTSLSAQIHKENDDQAQEGEGEGQGELL